MLPPGRDRPCSRVPRNDRLGRFIPGRDLHCRHVLAAWLGSCCFAPVLAAWLGSFSPSLPPGLEASPHPCRLARKLRPRRVIGTGLHNHSRDRLGRLLPCLPRLPRPQPRIARRRFSDHRPNAAPKGRRVLRDGSRAGPGPFPACFRAQWGPVFRILSLALAAFRWLGLVLNSRVCGLHSGGVPVQTPVLYC